MHVPFFWGAGCSSIHLMNPESQKANLRFGIPLDEHQTAVIFRENSVYLGCTSARIPLSYIGFLDGGFNYFSFSPLFGEDSQFDSYFSSGLKPPTRFIIGHCTKDDPNKKKRITRISMDDPNKKEYNHQDFHGSYSH